MRTIIQKKAPFLLPVCTFFLRILSIVIIPFLRRLKKDKNTQYVIPPNGMGELVIVYNYLEAYREKNKYDKIVVIAEEYRKECGDILSDDNVSFMYIKKKQHILLSEFGLSKLGNLYINNIKNVLYVDSVKRRDCTMESTFAQVKKLLGLNDNDKPVLKAYSDCEISHIVSKYNIDTSKAVYINPFARTVTGIDDNFYIKVVEELKKLGLSVYTLVSNDSQKALKGTIAVKCSLSETIAITKGCKGVIGIRSGFIDLMSTTQTKIICLYPSDNKKYIKYFSFKYCEWENDVSELVVDKRTDVIVEKMVELINK